MDISKQIDCFNEITDKIGSRVLIRDVPEIQLFQAFGFPENAKDDVYPYEVLLIVRRQGEERSLELYWSYSSKFNIDELHYKNSPSVDDIRNAFYKVLRWERKKDERNG